MDPYLYIDFDGVLHPNFIQKGQAFHLMPLLEEALEGYDVCLVISSSWRFHETPAYLSNLFPASLKPLLVGTTGPAHIGRWARWQEITYHAQRWGAKNWRALDDAGMEFPPQCPNLILCDGKIGIQHAQVQDLRAWLGDGQQSL